MNEYLSLGLSAAAFLVSAIALWRDKFFFRGTDITLANRLDLQRATALRYRDHPEAVRIHFPPFDDSMRCALVTLVWLNTGDRAGYVHIKNMDVLGTAGGLHTSKWSYKDVPAASAALHQIVVWGLPGDMVGSIQVLVTYEWPRIRPSSTSTVTATGRVSFELVAPAGIAKDGKPSS